MLEGAGERRLLLLGGWFTGSQPDQRTAKWFSRITREQAPWALEAGDPFRLIASLELLAVLFGAGIVEIAVPTDNQSNEALQRKGTTTKFPLCVTAMSLMG